MTTEACCMTAGLKIFDKEPEITLHEDVLYIPRIQGIQCANYGVYDQYGRLIPTAGPRRGWPNESLGQSQSSRISPSSAYPSSPEHYYFYGGHIGTHFGHFLTETLPRFWKPSLYKTGKILIHSDNSIKDLFELPWVEQIFDLLGVTKERFVIFDHPVRIPHLLIAGTSFEENHFAHRQFSMLCHDLAERCAVDPGDERPIFLSRANFKSQMRSIAGEEQVARILGESGFRIIHPETLSIREQMGLFSPQRPTCGFIGSSFHNSIFSRRPYGLALSTETSYSANFWLMDKINEACIQYTHAPSISRKSAPKVGVPTLYAIDAPEQIADIVLSFVATRPISTATTYATPQTLHYDRSSNYFLKTAGGLYLQTDCQLGLIRAGSGRGPRISRIIGNLSPSGWIELRSEAGDVISMDHLDLVGKQIALRTHVLGENAYALSHPTTRRFVSASPHGIVECNREQISEWERFILTPVY